MSIKRTIIVTAAIATAVAMVAPTFAGAVTIDELLAQIAALQAQLVALQGQAGSTTGTPAACAGITFTRNLVVGSTGSDVKCLQAILNQSATTKVAATGAGSPGNETTYFGNLTLAAVKIYQAEHGWTPANQVGPMTRAALNASLAGTPGVPPVVVPTGAGLTVQLASDTPASAIVVAGQGLAPLAKITFANGDSTEVKITNLKLTRYGVSADADLANIYLLQGATRLTDAASVSSNLITLNDSTGLFTVPAGGSTTITVASDICDTTTCSTIVGHTIGVKIGAATDITSNASSVKGSYPVNGNLMTVSNASLAGAQFAASASVTPATNSSLTPQNNYPVWQDTLTISTRAVNLTRMAFRVIGSVRVDDLQNFRLNIDGVNVGSAVARKDANGYVTFDLSSAPLKLETGAKTVKVLADIVNGSSYNFYLSIRVAADVNVVDTQYNANVLPTLASGSFPLAATSNGVQTIASGTMTWAKATTSPSGNIVKTASNATLAKYTITAAGEPIKITDMYVRAIFTNVSGTQNTDDDCAGSSAVCTTDTYAKLENGALYANGVQVGSTTDIGVAAAGTKFSLGSALVVTPGTPVTLEVKADITDATGTYNDVDATDTIQIRILGSTMVAQDTISLGTPTNPGNQDANTLTVASGSLSLSKYLAYTNQTIVPPVTNYKLGHFTLTSSSTEATNLNTIYVDLSTNNTVISNMYVKYGTQTTTTTASPSATALANSYSINHVLPAGQTIDIIVYGDVNSLATTSTYTSVKVNGTTVSSATAATTNSDSVLAGQTITFGTGTINAVKDGTTPANQAVAGNQTVTAAKFKFTASNSDYTVTELKFDITTQANAAAITSLILKDGSTILATVPYDNELTYFNVTGLSVTVPANTTKVLTVDLALATPYSNGVATTAATIQTAGKNLAVILQYIKTLNSSGVMHDAGSTTLADDDASVTIASSTTGTSTANYVYNYKTIPTFTYAALSDQGTLLGSGSQTSLYSFTVAADAKGDVALKQLKIPITITDNQTTNIARLSVFRVYRGSADITNTSTGGNAYVRNNSGNADMTAAAGATTSLSASGTADIVFYPEEVIPAGSTYTYTLKATPTGFDPAISTYSADSVTAYLGSDTTPSDGASGASAGDDFTGYFVNSSSNTAVQAYLYTSSAGTAAGESDNVIWSDMSAKSHSEAYNASTSDWFNGYLIKSLPLTTAGITAK